MSNPNQQPLGQRAKGKIRSIADLYAPTKEAEDRLKAIRLAISAQGEDVLPDFVSWPEYKKEDDGFPCLIVPHDKKVVEAIDAAQLDPLPQVLFCTSYTRYGPELNEARDGWILISLNDLTKLTIT